MKPEFYKIRHADLKQYSESEAYQKLEKKPVSQARIHSYLKNPNALPDDYLLYVLCNESQLIAFRTLLPDNYGNNPKIHFAWLSGNWVLPAYRGKGYSMQLLKAVKADWKDKLMYTNYAPESHALYQKSGRFHKISSRNGTRFYLFVKTQELLKHRLAKPLTWLLPIADFFISCYANFKTFISPKFVLDGYAIESMDQANVEFYKAFSERKKQGFQRTEVELKWILNYPWVLQSVKTQNYFFSYKAKCVYYRFLWIINVKGEKTGWAILHYRDGVLKVPYYQAGKSELICLARYIISFSKAKKVQLFSCFDHDLAASVNREKHPFILKKPAAQNIFATWEVNPDKPIVADGDGDYIFT